MTELTKPISRRTNTVVREAGQYRPVVVILKPPALLGFRAKGCKRTYWLPAEVCYAMAVRAEVEAARRAKRAIRKQRRLAK